ncbi:MAG TPA: inositol monophosphatase family protein [Mycobacteriales bacterium]|jgi:Archaeal fructose-1,6-bisphosphatase and related enzymes of inositol monophosphatase family
MTVDLDSLLPIAHSAVDIAAEIVRTHITGAVTAKGDRDMVTEIDFAVEQAVRTYLGERTPAFGFLGEEEGHAGTPSELTWVLDPVDGTANLVHDIPLCAVSLGLVHRRRPVLGVIDVPFLRTRYSAARDHGALRDGQPIRSSDTKDLDQAIVAIGDYATGDNAHQRNRARLAITAQLAARTQRVRMLGSAAIDLAWLAEGKLDATIALSNKPWDTAAGVIIAREAGASVVDIDGTDHTLDSTATIAATATLIDQVAALVQRAQAEQDAALGG